MLHAKLRNRTCQGLDRQGQGQGQGLTSLSIWYTLYILNRVRSIDWNRFRRSTMAYKGGSGSESGFGHGRREMVANDSFLYQ